jgi:hypothetical protein
MGRLIGIMDGRPIADYRTKITKKKIVFKSGIGRRERSRPSRGCRRGLIASLIDHQNRVSYVSSRHYCVVGRMAQLAITGVVDKMDYMSHHGNWTGLNVLAHIDGHWLFRMRRSHGGVR